MSQNILIVGAGPVGLTAAFELARRGLRPRIIDAAKGFAPLKESRALAVHLRTLDIFKASGISQSLQAVGNTVTNMQFLKNGQPLAVLNFADHEREDAALLVLPQGRTERILAKALSVYGVTPEWRTECIDVHNTNDDVCATIKYADGTIESTLFDIVIGCDGAHSCVRKSGGFSYAGSSMSVQWALVDVVYKTAFDPHTASANFITGVGAFAGFPLNANTVRYVGNHANIMDLVPRKHDIKDITWQSTFKVSYRMVSQFSRGKIFLAGDAAHIHSPAGGRGMNLGIEDAAWLAWMISEGRENQYSDARLPIARKTLKETKSQTLLITNTGILANFMRIQVLPFALKIKFLRARILNNLLALDTPAPPWLDE